ncbi:MAG: hypothetical protein ACYC61_26340 [Isosphaeraceae bacterium]
MPYPQVILPQADAACGKTFFADRRTADDHRVGLEVWNRATGRERPGYRLSAYRCRRCGGFHLAQRPVPPPRPTATPPAPEPAAGEPEAVHAADRIADEAGEPSPATNRPHFAAARPYLRGHTSSSVSPTPSP